MANRVLTIVAKVKDAASAGLGRIQNHLKKTGSAAKQTSLDFTQFNKVMFATTAYVGFFEKAFRGFGNTLMKGAELDRVVGQFERIMGPKGQLFDAIAGFTDNSIDKVEALRSAIQLKTLGIATNTKDIAEIIARAGTASKLAGQDSAEGIKKFTQFLKDGSIANLEFLNLIKSNDPALKLQMSMINKIGGVMGGALTAQMKYNMGLRLLRTATDGALKGQRDLYDVIFDVKQSFTLLKSEVGVFLGTALSSVIDKITKFADKLSTMLEYIRTSKKEILFLAKSLVVVASAFAGLLSSVGTIRLVSLGLKALGISTAPIILGISAILSLFSALTFNVKAGLTPVENFVEKLRVFGAVLKGVYQLVSSFITNQDNMRKGIGKMDKDLFELLNNNGLFLFVHNVSKTLAVVGKFGIEVFKQLRDWAIKLDEMFGGLTNKMFELFGVNKKVDVDLNATGNVVDEPAIKRAAKFWLDANSKSYGLMKKGAAAILTAFTAFKLFGIGKGFLSNLPLLGRFFGKSTSGKPDGTKGNPLHVTQSGIAGKAAGSIFKSNFAGIWMAIAPKLIAFAELISGIGTSIMTFARGLTGPQGLAVVYILASAFGFLTGVVQGVIDRFSSFTDLFGSVGTAFGSVDFSKMFSAVYEGISTFVVDLMNTIGTKISQAFDFLAPYLAIVIDPLKEAFSSLKGWVERAATALSSFYQWLATLPVVGDLVKGAAQFAAHPSDTYKGLGRSAVDAAAMGADFLNSKARDFKASNLLDASRGEGYGKFSVPESAEDRSDYAMRAIKQSSGAEQSRMARAYREAQLGTSAAGKEITAEEFASIFRMALDGSKVAKNTKDTAQEVKATQKTNLTSRRGGC